MIRSRSTLFDARQQLVEEISFGMQRMAGKHLGAHSVFSVHKHKPDDIPLAYPHILWHPLDHGSRKQPSSSYAIAEHSFAYFFQKYQQVKEKINHNGTFVQ